MKRRSFIKGAAVCMACAVLPVPNSGLFIAPSPYKVIPFTVHCTWYTGGEWYSIVKVDDKTIDIHHISEDCVSSP